MMDQIEEGKKKVIRDLENMQARMETLETDNDKLGKSKKKLQAEVEDMTVELENSRSQFGQMERRQKKFDQNLAEEKAISER